MIAPLMALGLATLLFTCSLDDAWASAAQWSAVFGVCLCLAIVLVVDRPHPDRRWIYDRVKLGVLCSMVFLILAPIPYYVVNDFDLDRVTDPKMLFATAAVTLALPLLLIVGILLVPMQSLARVSKRANTALLGLLLSFAGIEAYCRITAPPAPTRSGERGIEGLRVGNEYWWVPGPGQPRYWMKPGHDFVYTFPSNPRGYFDAKNRVVHTINPEGYRGPVRAIPKPAGTYRILILGDSAAFGWGVKDEDTVGALLQAQLGEKVGKSKLEIMTLAVPAYTTADELDLLRAKGLAYEPDLIAVWYRMNDVAAKFDPEKSESEFAARLPWYREWSKAIDASVRLVGRTVNQRRFTKDLVNAYKFDSAGWRNNKSLLREIKSLATARGAGMILVLEPDLTPLDRDSHIFLEPYRVVESFCESEGIPYYGLFEAVANADVNQLVVHPLDPHANEVANAKYVAFLAAHLRDDGILPAPADTSK